MSLSLQRIIQFVEELIEEETYDGEEGVWKFADGSHCSVCVNSALRIAREFDGSVMGYWSNSNPTARIGGSICEGHDFAFISGRWIVDFWSFRVARVLSSPVLDLDSESDSKLATRLFGERDAWEVLTV